VFHLPTAFSFTAALERHWQAVRDEYLGVCDALMDWPERQLYGEGWKVFGLFDLPHGRPIQANVARCPVTAELVAKHMPTHHAAGFSVMKPGTRIRPHVGYQGDLLRCHLGLEVPAGDCALRVGGETRQWQPGRVLVFDDHFIHEAWNLTDEDRAILLIDFVPSQIGSSKGNDDGKRDATPAASRSES